ncbi:MAG: hypothetical protein IKN72_08830 [Clostridia bacterium]|nr:hypothetical protein [Clostridia bacterium]
MAKVPRQPSAADVAAKRRATNIKSAQGIFFLFLLMTPIYLLYTCTQWNFRFYFCLFVPEFLFKASHFTREFDNDFSQAFLDRFADRLSTPLTWVLIALILVIFLAAGIAAQRNPRLLLVSLALCVTDTAALVTGRILSLPEAFSPEGWIDVIFHAFLLFLLIVGTIAAFQHEPVPAAGSNPGGKKKKKKKKKR